MRVNLFRAHGTYRRYENGCRCRLCKYANTLYHQKYRSDHADEIRTYKLQYQKAHPQSYLANGRNRAAKKRDSVGTHTPADVRNQRERQGGRCYWCGVLVGERYHADHVTPLSRGGSNGPENIVVSCPACNMRKHDAHPMDFAGRLL